MNGDDDVLLGWAEPERAFAALGEHVVGLTVERAEELITEIRAGRDL